GSQLPGTLLQQAPSLLTSLRRTRSEEHTSELQSHLNLVCRLLLEKTKEAKWQRILRDLLSSSEMQFVRYYLRPSNYLAFFKRLRGPLTSSLSPDQALSA